MARPLGSKNVTDLQRAERMIAEGHRLMARAEASEHPWLLAFDDAIGAIRAAVDADDVPSELADVQNTLRGVLATVGTVARAHDLAPVRTLLGGDDE